MYRERVLLCVGKLGIPGERQLWTGIRRINRLTAFYTAQARFPCPPFLSCSSPVDGRVQRVLGSCNDINVSLYERSETRTL